MFFLRLFLSCDLNVMCSSSNQNLSGVRSCDLNEMNLRPLLTQVGAKGADGKRGLAAVGEVKVADSKRQKQERAPCEWNRPRDPTWEEGQRQ